MSAKEPELDAAYSLETPEDNIRLYADWAQTYDDVFSVDMDYQLPAHVAAIFLDQHDGSSPVLDVGAGTGQVTEHIKASSELIVDALDISPDMLQMASEKALYRSLIVGDLTKSLEIEDETYSAVVSAGTFTHGHVGPNGLDELLRIAKTGALFALSINAKHFHAAKFDEKFHDLRTRIRDFRTQHVRNFGDKADEDHRHDLGNVVTFKKV